MYHARARPRASEYGIGMRYQGVPVHLVIDHDWPTESACGRPVPLRWTYDAQAVTCPACIGKMELQPA